MTTTLARCSGRSLIEVMVALGLASILTAATVPSYTFLVHDSRITNVADELHGMLFTARTEAVKRGQTVQINSLAGSTSWTSGARSFVDADGDGNQDPGEVVLWETGPVPGNLSLTGDAASLRYLPSGTLTVSPTVVNFTVCKPGVSGEEGRTVSISQTGRPSVVESVCS